MQMARTYEQCRSVQEKCWLRTLRVLLGKESQLSFLQSKVEEKTLVPGERSSWPLGCYIFLQYEQKNPEKKILVSLLS